jgi:Predicted nucleic-acid-binding protein containing a Zn-ribbon domain
MIECPYCYSEVEIKNGRCPECKRRLDEVDEEDFLEDEQPYANAEDMIRDSFKCSKCKHDDCEIKEVAMTGTGLSKLFDIEHNHFLFVSCTNCGFVEVYNPDILNGHKAGKMGTIMDILFGG